MSHSSLKHRGGSERNDVDEQGSRGTAVRAVSDSSSSDESTELLCRICFSPGETKGNELIAPCMCKGSQKWVHVSCLQRWQRAMQVIGAGDFASEKATTCSVCQGRFALDPPERPLLERLWALVKDMMLTLVTITFAIFLNRSLIIVAVVAVMLVLAYRCPILCAAMAIAVCASLHSLGIRPVVTHDDDGGFLVGPGSIFFRSVTLVLEHDHLGSLALILNKPVARSMVAASQDDGVVLPGELLTVRGGPVRINEERRIMHKARGVVGARVILSQDQGNVVYLGGELPAVLAAIAQQQQPEQHDEEGARAIIFDGCARWAPGQLHGELRAGSWRWLNAPWPEEVGPGKSTYVLTGNRESWTASFSRWYSWRILLSTFDQHGGEVDTGEAMYHNIMENYGAQLMEFND
ncbi:hypothetical protein FOZ60_010072 [Perkinsus olseni]|uniref:RING-CH-type domain-containing protein n=1 Tax=Perkinsus olseni TaxID=32597 RepID=A0A7J6NG49_PEROL|nr:hypothetical protein FOZ60_010072 [Perkinsus olseni]